MSSYIQANYKVSPNEAARLVQEETQKRRRLRLLQVREQAKYNAAKVRRAVREEKERQLQKLAEELQEAWMRECENEICRLQQKYEENLAMVGKGHSSAKEKTQQNMDEQRLILQVEAAHRAMVRGSVALQKAIEEKNQQLEEDQKHIISRQAALLMEKSRSAEVSAREPPVRNPIDDIKPVGHKPVRVVDKEAFSHTHLHINPDYDVVKEQSKECAEHDATNIQKYIDKTHKEKRQLSTEYKEKAALRGKVALHLEHLKHDYQHLLQELNDLQKEDVTHRQQKVHTIPTSINAGTFQQLSNRKQFQNNLERAFENLYMPETELARNSNAIFKTPTKKPVIETTHALDLSDTESDDKVSEVLFRTNTSNSTIDPQLPTAAYKAEHLNEKTNVSTTHQLASTALTKPRDLHMITCVKAPDVFTSATFHTASTSESRSLTSSSTSMSHSTVLSLVSDMSHSSNSFSSNGKQLDTISEGTITDSISEGPLSNSTISSSQGHSMSSKISEGPLSRSTISSVTEIMEGWPAHNNMDESCSTCTGTENSSLIETYDSGSTVSSLTHSQPISNSTNNYSQASLQFGVASRHLRTVTNGADKLVKNTNLSNTSNSTEVSTYDDSSLQRLIARIRRQQETIYKS